MKHVRRRILGRRRYSWERSQPLTPTPEPSVTVGLIVILGTTYLFMKPLFWLFLSIVALLLIGAIAFGVATALSDHAQRRREIRTVAFMSEKAIGVASWRRIINAASITTKGTMMTHDRRFALIDRDGDERFAAIIKGTYQIGKARDELPTNLEDFAKAILLEKKDGRFVCNDGRKQGMLSFSGEAREAVAYRLDSSIATRLGVATKGSR